MKPSLLHIKKTLSCNNNANTLLSLLLASSLAACGSGASDPADVGDVDNTVGTNTVPFANAGEDQILLIGSTATLSGEASSDTDGDTLSYSWSLSTLPDGSIATLSSDTDSTTSFSADVAGIYVVTLMVNDDEANSEIDSVNITVSEVIDSSTTSILSDYSYHAYNDSDSVQLDSIVTWSCTDEDREIAANGVPDHAVGTFPNNNTPKNSLL
ncbi:PKD domain-containing protein [Colwellia sp. 4_MG-2023]|uniref:PKD domain-containing protein n=1 Tax=unclassified Colwellia TaxID=196834 RepID=UPI0026E3738B|nr:MULTISPECIES: PKD domain-containing protein [unclassified Colwellia]MDO6506506.1 PKD domain-containing protein [Colwellia sp. 5_MG-2023]MDO6554993.1 PKD domain-containing protein [Colwellia sp. 4_MG-2023]